MSIALLRRVAYAILFGGWVVPLMLAALVGRRLGPEAGPEAAALFRWIGYVWAFCAASYGMILLMRFRRGLSD